MLQLESIRPVAELGNRARGVRLSTLGWTVLAAEVVAFDLVACRRNETLSEGAHDALERWPVVTNAAIAITALHLMHRLPERIDPFSRALKAARH